MKAALLRYYRAQQFDPGPVGLLINPFYLARRALWRAVRTAASGLRGQLLDVGCGSMPYRALFAVDAYTGLDIDSETTRRRGVADILYDGTVFPLADASFDCVLCNQVLEHVFEPERFIAEVRRVLRVDGRLLLTVPFVWDEHEQPFDYARYTSFGLRALLERSGFEIVEQRKLLADASALFQLYNAYVFKVTRTRWPIISLCLTAVFAAPASLIGLVFGRILPANPDLFLDQLVLARKTS